MTQNFATVLCNKFKDKTDFSTKHACIFEILFEIQHNTYKTCIQNQNHNNGVIKGENIVLKPRGVNKKQKSVVPHLLYGCMFLTQKNSRKCRCESPNATFRNVSNSRWCFVYLMLSSSYIFK